MRAGVQHRVRRGRQRHGGRREDQHQGRGDQDVAGRELHLAGADLLAQVLGRTADHQSGDEHRDDRHDQHSVEAGAGTTGCDLAQLHAQDGDSAAQTGERGVEGVHRARRGQGGRHREDRGGADADALFLALHRTAGGLERRAVVGELGPHHQGDEADPDGGHGGEDRVALPDRADHHAEGAGQRERDHQQQEDLEQVGERGRVLEGVGAVGVEVASAVGAQLLDGLLRGDRAAVPLLVAAHELADLVNAGEVLDGTAGHEHEGRDDRQRDQDADRAAHQVGPEVAEFTGAGAREAPYESDRDGDADGRGDEVLHGQTGGLHDVTHGLLAVVRLPVGVRHERDGRVERLRRVHRGEAQRAGQDALEALEEIEEEDADGREGEYAAQIRGPAHLGVRVGTDALVDPLLDAPVLVGGVDPGHVGAEGDVDERQCRYEGDQLEHAGEDGTHTLLRTSPGRSGRGRDSPAGRRPRRGRRCSRRSQLRHPLGDEGHQREDRDRGDDEGQIGHRELLE